MNDGVLSKALMEYIGDYPGLASHGNSKIVNAPYIRIAADTLSNIDKQVNNNTPKELYKKMITTSDMISAPCDVKQIENRKYKAKRNEAMAPTSSNAADNIQS